MEKIFDLATYSVALAKLYCSLSIEEKKILGIVFRKINPEGGNGDTFRIEKTELLDRLNLTGERRYERCFEHLEGLRSSTKYTIRTDAYDVSGIMVIGTRWFHNEPYCEITINPKFMSDLEKIKAHYSHSTLQMNSGYMHSMIELFGFNRK